MQQKRQMEIGTYEYNLEVFAKVIVPCQILSKAVLWFQIFQTNVKFPLTSDGLLKKGNYVFFSILNYGLMGDNLTCLFLKQRKNYFSHTNHVSLEISKLHPESRITVILHKLGEAKCFLCQKIAIFTFLKKGK